MFRQNTRIAMLTGLVVLIWVLAAGAAPITYTSTSYNAYGYAQNGMTWVDDTQSAATLPIDATATEGNASAHAWANNTTRLEAQTSASTDGVTGSYTMAWMTAELKFTATFPVVNIYYDHTIALTANPGALSGYAYADGLIMSFLEDLTTSDFPWQHTPFYFTSDGDINVSGTVNKAVSLTVGNDYGLYLSAYYLSADADYDVGNASAHVLLNNIQIDAVPLPAGLLLLGTGLLGLWGWNRRGRG